MRIAVITSLLLLCFQCSLFAQSISPEDEAREAFKQGVAAFDQGRVSDALVAFERAYSLKPAFKLLYNIGQAQADLKLTRQAIQSFEKYLREGGDKIEPERRAEVEAEIARLRLVSGTPAPNQAPQGETITMKIRISVHRDVSKGLAALPWAVGGLALTTATLGTVFGTRALSIDHSLSENCAGGKCAPKFADDVNSLHRSAVAADVMFIFTGVLTAATASLFAVVVHKKKGKKK